MKLKPKKFLYKRWLIKWLNQKKDFVKESTYANYQNIIFNHLIPDLGDKYLKEFNHELLQNYILEKLRNGNTNKGGALSEKSVKDIMLVVKSSLRYAIELKIIPLINLQFSYPRNDCKSKIYVFSKREQQKITEYALNKLTPRNLGLLICLYSGIRIGELCALRWGDIDFKTNTIHINKTLQRVYFNDSSSEGSPKIVVSSPKTINSNRDIPISREFANLIKPLKTENEHYLLTSSLNCVEPRAYRKHFNLTLKKLKIKHINFHSLRHTFATNCISLGIDYKTVSELLGHSDISTTLNLYVHPNLSQKKKCINTVWKNHK